MTPEEIKSTLAYNCRDLPSEAMTEAIAQREAMTPILLAELERLAEDPQSIIDQPPPYRFHIFAMFLLAQLREPRALAPILKVCHFPADDLETLFGDLFTEDMGSILASVCQGDISSIKRFIENNELDEFSRAAGLDALITLYAEGALQRDTLVDYLRDISRKLPHESLFWRQWAIAADEIYPEELMPEVRAAYDAGLVDPGFIGLDDFESTVLRGRETAFADLRRVHHYVTDAVQSLEDCRCFCDTEETLLVDEEDLEILKAGARTLRVVLPQMLQQTRVPYSREAPKVGRNDPCPCGSGQKYKKCCMVV